MVRNAAAYLLFGFFALNGAGFALTGNSVCRAEDWATKMFETQSHDFGTVARGAKAAYRFQVKNIYEEDVHIAWVRSSCGCTTPQIVKPDLKTFETGEIVAEFNTINHVGQKHATVTVGITKPFYTEVQLQITGTIRSDVVVTPGDVKFGTVDQGRDVEKAISVVYAGRNDWQIVDVKTVEPCFEVRMTETERGGGRVGYELKVRMTKEAPSGYVKDQLILVTNDAKAPQLFVDIDGRVVSPITLSPSSLFMGVVHPGQTVKKNLVVRGKQPFKIVDIKCDDKAFAVAPGLEAKQVHIVPVEFTAQANAGKVSREITLTTDVGDGDELVFKAYAQVVNNAPAAAKDAEKIEEPAEPAADESESAQK